MAAPWEADLTESSKPWEKDIVGGKPPVVKKPKSSDQAAGQNVKSFLRVIREAEGADYNTLFGGGKFQDFSEHPLSVGAMSFTNTDGERKTTSAAGAYQFQRSTWESLKKRLKLDDFSPANQDIAALELIREAGALEDVQAGRLDEAVQKVAPIWASLPGSPHAQKTRTPEFIKQAFMKDRQPDDAAEEQGAPWEADIAASDGMIEPDMSVGDYALELGRHLVNQNFTAAKQGAGIIEQLAAGAGGLGELAVYAPQAAYAATVEKVEGGQFVNTFIKEYGKLIEGSFFSLFRPETEEGKEIFNGLGLILDDLLSVIPNKIRAANLKSMPAPILGTLPGLIADMYLNTKSAEERDVLAKLAYGAEVAVSTLGAFGPAIPKGKAAVAAAKQRQTKAVHDLMERDLNTNPAQFMAKWYPETWANMTQGQVGKVETALPLSVDQKVSITMSKNLEALGVQPEAYKGMSISQMAALLLEKADSGNTINAGARQAIMESFTKQVEHLSQIDQAISKKALPSPSPVPGTVEVTPSGRAATPEQRAEGWRVFDQLTNEERSEVLGVGPMGILRTRVESWQRAQREGREGGTRDGVETAFAQSFPLGKNRPGISKMQRRQVLDAWLAEGAPYIPWEQLAARIYVRPKVKPGQTGVVNLEGLPDLAKVTFATLENLPDKLVLKRSQIEETLRQQHIRQGERDTVQRVLKQFEGDNIPSRDFAEALGKEAIPLELRPNEQFADFGHNNIKSAEDRAGDMTWVVRSPFRTDISNHFGDPNYVAHLRGFADGDGKVFHITEIQSDLYQKLDTQTPPRTRSRVRAEIERDASYHEGQAHNWRNIAREHTKYSDIQMTILAREAAMQTDPHLVDTATRFPSERPRENAISVLNAAADGQIEKARKIRQRSASIAPDSLLDATKYWYERVLREFEKVAEQSTVRVPLGDTAAVMENWPRFPIGNPMVEVPITRLDSPAARSLLGTGKNTVTLKFITELDTMDGHQDGFWEWTNPLEPDDIFPIAATPQGMMHDTMVFFGPGKDRQAFLRSVAGLPHKVAPKYKGLHRFYEQDVRKFVEKEYGAKEVTDSRGFHWMEYDPPMPSERVPMFGPARPAGKAKGGKQAGIVDMELLGVPAKGLAKAAKVGAKGGGLPAAAAQAADGEAFKRREAKFQRMIETVDSQEKGAIRTMVSKAANQIADHQGDLKSLLRRFGTYGEEVILKMIVEHGATRYAKHIFQKKAKPLFKGLSKAEDARLAQLMRARMEVHNGSAEAAAWIREYKKLNSEKFADLDRRADQVFALYREQIAEAHIRGLIPKDDYMRLFNLDFQGNEYAGLLDPVHGGRTDSGIPYVKNTDKVILSARAMMQEVIGRVQNRIAKNDTLTAMHDLLEANKGNPNLAFLRPLAKGEKAPPGFVKLTAMKDAKPHAFAMEAELADLMVNRPQFLDSYTADVLRWLTLSHPFKMIAVSYDPLWPIAGMPMDALHIYASAQGYSKHLPTFLKEYGADLATVSLDGIRRKGRYIDALKEGLGFEFLTHQARALVTHKPTLRESLDPRLEGTVRALTYMSETSEIVARLAHRERLIKNGMPSWKATALARDRLDFSQGGAIAKVVEVGIPFTNVAVQALRAGLREVKRDPKAGVAKITWAVAAINAWVQWQIQAHPECWADIPTYDKVGGFPICLPDMDFEDSTGAKRYGYMVIRSEHILAPIHAAVVGYNEKAMLGEAPDELISNSLEAMPFTGDIPILKAITEYQTNHNMTSDSPIYSGIAVPPHMQYKGSASTRPTPEVYKMLGELTGGSPQGMEQAARSLVPNNPWFEVAGWAKKLALGTQDPSVRAKGTKEMMSESPIVRSTIKFTHPAIKQMNAAQEAHEQYGEQLKPLYDTIDAYVVKRMQGDLQDEGQVRAWLSTQPQEFQEKLVKRYKNGVAVERVMRRFKAGSDTPVKGWWMNLSNAPAEVRAVAFFDRWISEEPAGRQQMERTARALQQQGIGFLSDNFRREFGKLRSQYGTERR